MSKHTPGPWRADEFPSGGWWISVDDSPHAGKGVGSVHRYEDAHLIAAAPELLAALESLVFGLEHAPNADALTWAGAIIGARDAIAKARNEGVHEDARED